MKYFHFYKHGTKVFECIAALVAALLAKTLTNSLCHHNNHTYIHTDRQTDRQSVYINSLTLPDRYVCISYRLNDMSVQACFYILLWTK